MEKVSASSSSMTSGFLRLRRGTGYLNNKSFHLAEGVLSYGAMLHFRIRRKGRDGTCYFL